MSSAGCSDLHCYVRQDLKETFIDSGVMTAIREWISPLPDKSLPALRIREELLRILMEVRALYLEGGGGQEQNCVTVCGSREVHLSEGQLLLLA